MSALVKCLCVFHCEGGSEIDDVTLEQSDLAESQALAELAETQKASQSGRGASQDALHSTRVQIRTQVAESRCSKSNPINPIQDSTDLIVVKGVYGISFEFERPAPKPTGWEHRNRDAKGNFCK